MRIVSENTYLILFLVLIILFSVSCTTLPQDADLTDTEINDDAETSIVTRTEVSENREGVETISEEDLIFDDYPEAYLYFIEQNIEKYPIKNNSCDEDSLLFEMKLFLQDYPYRFRFYNNITFDTVIEKILDKMGCYYEDVTITFSVETCYFERYYNLSNLEDACYDFLDEHYLYASTPGNDNTLVEEYVLSDDAINIDEQFCIEFKEGLEKKDIHVLWYNQFFDVSDELEYDFDELKYHYYLYGKDYILNSHQNINYIFDCYSFVEDAESKAFFEKLVDEFITVLNDKMPEYDIESFNEFCISHNFCISDNINRFKKAFFFKPELKCDSRAEKGCIFFVDPNNSTYSDISNLRIFLWVLSFNGGHDELVRNDPDFIPVKLPQICSAINDDSGCEILSSGMEKDICHLLRGENCGNLGFNPHYEEFCEQIEINREFREYMQGLYC